MTLIAAVKDRSTKLVAMACDSQVTTTEGDVKLYLQRSKICVSGPFLVGCCGGGHFAQVVEHFVDYEALAKLIPEEGATLRYMVREFIPVLRQVCDDQGVLLHKQSDEGELQLPGGLLVAIEDKLYIIDSDLDVVETTDGYAAIGSGELPARSVLRSLEYSEFDAIDRLRIALDAVAYIVASVGGRPRYFQTLHGSDPYEVGVGGDPVRLLFDKLATTSRPFDK